MHRKSFLSFLATASVSPKLMASSDFDEQPASPFVIPPNLRKGDTIGITCPAGFITLEAIQPSLKLMQSWGFNIKIGATVGKRDFSFGGTDAERLDDFQKMIDDPSVKAIMCARGGYGAVRFVDKLRLDKLITNPKWIIGFSDITVIHSHLARNARVASIHSKMCNSFPDEWAKADAVQAGTILSIRDALNGTELNYNVLPSKFNKAGEARGILVGGNLKTLETLAGTRSDLPTDNCILFIEDTNEYLYSIDRMVRNLARTGKLAKLAALIIGGFKVKPDDPGEEFGRSLYEIVLEQVNGNAYPVCFDFPVGHQKNNFALKCGVEHFLKVSDAEVIFKEWKA
ncbi:MAG: LD-carboxypeptidase [Flavitalea sp.]